MDYETVEIKQEPELNIIENTFIVQEVEIPRTQPKQQEQPLRCKICKKGFREEDLPVHLTIHAKENYCSNCYKIFKNVNDLVKHRLTCKERLNRIAELQSIYKDTKLNVNLIKTNLLCVTCKDTLFETDCDGKLHCLSCVPGEL